MRVAFFEDRPALEFGPIAQLRPNFELVCGHHSVRERVVRSTRAAKWGGFVRELLVDAYRERNPEAQINETAWLRDGPTLFVNGGWVASPEAAAAIDPQTVGLIDGAVAFLTIEPGEGVLFESQTWESAIYQIARTRRRVAAPGRLLNRPWELVERNSAQITSDFEARTGRQPWTPQGPQVALIGSPDRVAVDHSARIDPFVVLDASGGPISIDAGVQVQSFTRLEGPCHVGLAAQLFRANIRGGTTIGPHCRVGGEIEASILHGSVNKYHDGFVGHSYICPWVNLGALSTSSDLKNDYSLIRVPLEGKSLETGLVKVGCFIGDHTKTGLGSLFNTGSSIGVMCMILPGGELLPRHVPSFSAVWHGELAEAIPFERSLSGARHALERRNQELTRAEERLLRSVYQATLRERNDAIDRFAEQRRLASAGAELR